MECFIEELYSVILERLTTKPKGSYTAFLAEKGVEYISRKIGEEATELIIEAVKNNREGIINEACDLIYHLLVLLAVSNVGLESVIAELVRRRK